MSLPRACCRPTNRVSSAMRVRPRGMPLLHWDPTSGAAVVSMDSGNSMTRNIGVISSLFYSFKNKYIINGTYRWEANSSLSAEHRWKGFPAVGVAWHLGDEEAVKEIGRASCREGGCQYW